MAGIAINPKLLKWARERASLTVNDLMHTFPKYAIWESGQGEDLPTLKQIERFAAKTRVPVGYLFLPEPPEENLPIQDLRTLDNQGIGNASPDLLDVISLCQRRQDWYRGFAVSAGEDPLSFVGSARITDDAKSVASRISKALEFDVQERSHMSSWEVALKHFMGRVESIGILVMCSGIVASNTHRVLKPEEFRGFALSDEYAPLIFINGVDTKAAQIFTLAHELAHIWLGQSAVSDAGVASFPSRRIEQWSNEVAAELLVPLDVVCAEYKAAADLKDEMNRLARQFNVSTLVILRRLHDAKKITRTQFDNTFSTELTRLRALAKKRREDHEGGDFYPTAWTRVGKRFARAIITNTLEGQTLYRDALHLLGFRQMKTFDELGRQLGVGA